MSHRPCAHCGLPAPQGSSDDAPVFCCQGCRLVHDALHGAGLGDYYDLRAQFGSSQASEAARAPGVKSCYEHFDDAVFLQHMGATEGHAQLRLKGLHCAACVWVLERLPKAVPGVRSARVDYGSSRITLDWDPEHTSLGRIAGFLEDLGYPPDVLERPDAQRTRASRSEVWRLAVTGALAGNIMLASVALYAGELATMEWGFVSLFEWLSLLLSIPAVTWGAWPFYRGAWAGLRMGVLHMDLPIALGVLGGFLGSVLGVLGHGEVYFDTIAILVFLLLLGRSLQQRGQRHVMDQGEMMQSLSPPVARRRVGDDWVETYVGRVVVGDEVRVDTGEVIPVDGRVRSGRSHVDQSLLSGESRPLPVTTGSRVYAGTRNMSGALRLEVTATGTQTRVAAIARGLSGDDRAAHIKQLADRVAGWFVAAVLLFATLGGVVWWVIAPERAFDVVVAMLVVSCPCALGLATPMALTVARGRAARCGILLRTSAALEALARVRRIVLDKTGTLTAGRLSVVRADLSDASVAALVAAVERGAEHPIAQAIVRWAEARDASIAPIVAAFEEHAGDGVTASVDGRSVRIGRLGWIPHQPTWEAAIAAALALGASPVLVEIDGVVAGCLALGDQVRPEARSVLAHLRSLGKTLEIGSGDHPALVADVAATLGIAVARGGLSPEDKAALVESAPDSSGAGTIMVGDGINDALALKRATVGVAVRGGAEAALSVADVYLVGGDLRSLAALFDGARRTLGVIRTNLVFSLVYNVVFATLALTGHITPLWAAVLMPLSSLTVVGSSFLFPTFRPPYFRDTEPGAADAPSGRKDFRCAEPPGTLLRSPS